MVFSERELPIASSAVKPLPSLGTTVLHLTNYILERRNSEQTCSLRERVSQTANMEWTLIAADSHKRNINGLLVAARRDAVG